MRFPVECFENVEAFSKFYDTAEKFDDHTVFGLRRVANLTIEAPDAMTAANDAFEIANAPWEPADAEGVTWDHQRVRSMSSGDVVVVHTPDGPVAYGCLFIGWATLPPEMFPAGVDIA